MAWPAIIKGVAAIGGALLGAGTAQAQQDSANYQANLNFAMQQQTNMMNMMREQRMQFDTKQGFTDTINGVRYFFDPGRGWVMETLDDQHQEIVDLQTQLGLNQLRNAVMFGEEQAMAMMDIARVGKDQFDATIAEFKNYADNGAISRKELENSLNNASRGALTQQREEINRTINRVSARNGTLPEKALASVSRGFAQAADQSAANNHLTALTQADAINENNKNSILGRAGTFAGFAGLQLPTPNAAGQAQQGASLTGQLATNSNALTAPRFNLTTPQWGGQDFTGDLYRNMLPGALADVGMEIWKSRGKDSGGSSKGFSGGGKVIR